MIKSLRIRNFKCFEDQTFEMGHVTLLSGLNGMGKSSMIQTLLLLRQSFQQGLLPKTGLALNGDLVRIGTAQDALFQDAKNEIIGIELILTDETTARWYFNTYNKEADVLDIVRTKSKVNRRIFDFSLFGDDFHYLEAERIGPRTSFGMSDSAVIQHRQIGRRGEYAVHFLNVFGKRTITGALTHSGDKSSTLSEQVENWVGEISPGTRIHIEPHPSMDVVNLRFSFGAVKHVIGNFRSTNVGFGITYTLPLLIALLSSSPGSLLLIENPEAHLHPKGQVRMGELISRAAASGIQVVVETHSDHILNGIRLAVYKGLIDSHKVKLHFFERSVEEGQSQVSVVSPKIDRDGRIDRWPDGFFDVWDKCLEALLEPRNGQES